MLSSPSLMLLLLGGGAISGARTSRRSRIMPGCVEPSIVAARSRGDGHEEPGEAEEEVAVVDAGKCLKLRVHL